MAAFLDSFRSLSSSPGIGTSRSLSRRFHYRPNPVIVFSRIGIRITTPAAEAS